MNRRTARHIRAGILLAREVERLRPTVAAYLAPHRGTATREKVNAGLDHLAGPFGVPALPPVGIRAFDVTTARLREKGRR